MTVFAIQEPMYKCRQTGEWRPKINLRDAESFGDVITLIPGQHVNAALVTQPTMHKLKRELQHFGDCDYILPVGDITLVGMAIAVAMNVNRGRAKLLRWNREERRYDVVEANLFMNREEQ